MTVINDHAQSMRFSAVRGMLRITPIAGTGLILASLSTSAFPLLAGFPARLALWDGLARVSLNGALWLGVGMVGLLISSFRSMAVLSMADEYTGWELREGWLPGIMLGLGMIGLFILGLFPQIVQSMLSNLPAMFEQLGR
jgi:formate hydrogenlyase subunit 3/multisubunit Na+/H+ antiporter MnhD subunit